MEWLNDIALFVEVGKTLSFRRAAETLNIPSSTVSRRVNQLEQAIGLRLLHRTTRKVEFTEAGQLYFERCQRIVEEARLAHEQLGDMLAQPSGILRASLPVDFATIFLTPLITQFAAQYPHIQFEFDLTPRQVDLLSDNVDVAIRIGELPNTTLIARKLTQFQSKLFASPTYIKRYGLPVQPSDLSHHDCICFIKNKAWTLYQADLAAQVSIQGRFQLNNIGMMRRLALLDQGITFLLPQVVEADVQQGLLVPVLPEWYGESLPVYALTATRLLPAKTRCFIDFLRAHIPTLNS